MLICPFPSALPWAVLIHVGHTCIYDTTPTQAQSLSTFLIVGRKHMGYYWYTNRTIELFMILVSDRYMEGVFFIQPSSFVSPWCIVAIKNVTSAWIYIRLIKKWDKINFLYQYIYMGQMKYESIPVCIFPHPIAFIITYFGANTLLIFLQFLTEISYLEVLASWPEDHWCCNW